MAGKGGVGENQDKIRQLPPRPRRSESQSMVLPPLLGPNGEHAFTVKYTGDILGLGLCYGLDGRLAVGRSVGESAAKGVDVGDRVTEVAGVSLPVGLAVKSLVVLIGKMARPLSIASGIAERALILPAVGHVPAHDVTPHVVCGHLTKRLDCEICSCLAGAKCAHGASVGLCVECDLQVFVNHRFANRCEAHGRVRSQCKVGVLRARTRTSTRC